MMIDQPTSTKEVAELVQSSPRVVAVGGGTKGLLEGSNGVQRIELSGLSGMTDYDASEFTFTAKAGTRVEEVCEVLAAQGQFLPFDPHWMKAGATLGGTVASGISGPRRFRYGGLRDFLLGIEFVDGCGRVVRSGGRVVKNAAGFDLSKFMVGSLGSFGVLTELTFKVFPKGAETATLRVECAHECEARDRMVELARGRLELDAIEYAPDLGLIIQIGAPQPALDSLCSDVMGRWPGEVTRWGAEEAAGYWRALTEMKWAQGGDRLVKIPVTPSRIARLESALMDFSRHYSAGGSALWIACDESQLDAVSEVLMREQLKGLVLGGSRRWVGWWMDDSIVGAVKEALDPEGRFPKF